jgi:hypothetical protein
MPLLTTSHLPVQLASGVEVGTKGPFSGTLYHAIDGNKFDIAACHYQRTTTLKII